MKAIREHDLEVLLLKRKYYFKIYCYLEINLEEEVKDVFLFQDRVTNNSHVHKKSNLYKNHTSIFHRAVTNASSKREAPDNKSFEEQRERGERTPNPEASQFGTSG